MKTVPLAGTLAAGRVAVVDDDDLELVLQYRWHAHQTVRRGRASGPYVRTCTKQADGTWITIYMHKLITGWPRTDHKNGDGLDNQRANLRPATAGQNMANSLPRAGGSSPYRGVHWSPRHGKWRAQILVDGRQRHLGYFAAEDDAAQAFEVAYFGAWGTNSSTKALLDSAMHGKPLPDLPTKESSDA